MTTPYYQDDLVTLYHGDSLELTEWTAADVLVTDPPYGVRYQSGSMTRATRTLLATVAGDEDTTARDAALAEWGAKPAMIFGGWRQPRPEGTRHLLIWHKAAAKPGYRTSAWFPAHEEIYVLGDGWAGKPHQSVYTTTQAQDGAQGLVAQTGHPTPKPVPLMEALISSCPPGVIADPFAGSGATLIAARNLGREVIGVELEERYCEGIARRLSQQAFDFSALEPITPDVRSSGWPRHDDETGLFKEWTP